MRGITWVKAALKDFQKFPEPVQRQVIGALRMAAVGEKAEIAKPMKGLGSGIFEIAARYRGATFRAVYAVQMDKDIWALHVFEKKSKTGIKTPEPEIDLIRQRIRRVTEQLQ
jgi:phage-related protein